MRHGVPGSVQTEPPELGFARQSLAGRAWPLFSARRPDRLLEGITKTSHLNLGGTANRRHAELFALKCKDLKGSSTNSFNLMNSEAKLLFVSYLAIPF